MPPHCSDNLFGCLIEGLTPEIYTELETDIEVIELFHKIIPRLIKNKLGDVDETLCDDLSSEMIVSMGFTCKDGRSYDRHTGGCN